MSGGPGAIIRAVRAIATSDGNDGGSFGVLDFTPLVLVDLPAFGERMWEFRGCVVGVGPLVPGFNGVGVVDTVQATRSLATILGM